MSTPPYPPPSGPPDYGPPGYAPPGYPPPGYPPPGYGPPAQPPKRGHTLRNVLIIVGIVAVLCCGGAIGGGAFLINKALGAVKPAEDATGAFITDLESDNYSDAYGMLCANTRTIFTADSFSQVVQAQPHISGHRITGAFVSNNNGHTSATVDAQLTRDTGPVASHTFVLVKENGAWKVCGAPY